MNHAWLLCLGIALVGCKDPVNDARINQLGPEQSGVPKGPLHRPGQPCTVCHSSSGGRTPEFSLAGTLFFAQDSRVPLAGGVIQVVDSAGSVRLLTANAAGNFYVAASDWSPTFPLWTSIAYTCGNAARTYVHVDMVTQIFRSSACADCHFDPLGPTSTGHIFLTETAPGPCK